MSKPPITHETVIGDLLQAYPEALPVIKKHFGNGCFTCPGMAIESIGFGAMMHGMDLEPILKDLRETVGAEIE
jgi:hybrid cluster-associated redox disulfide protein